MNSKQRLFNIARFEHENEMRRKALQQKKNLESSPFWNPESSTRNPESTGWNPESKTVMDSLTWGENLVLINFYSHCNLVAHCNSLTYAI